MRLRTSLRVSSLSAAELVTVAEEDVLGVAGVTEAVVDDGVEIVGEDCFEETVSELFSDPVAATRSERLLTTMNAPIPKAPKRKNTANPTITHTPAGVRWALRRRTGGRPDRSVGMNAE